jgi:hypothetical protein
MEDNWFKIKNFNKREFLYLRYSNMKAITIDTHKLFALVKTLTREAFDKLEL